MKKKEPDRSRVSLTHNYLAVRRSLMQSASRSFGTPREDFAMMILLTPVLLDHVLLWEPGKLGELYEDGLTEAVDCYVRAYQIALMESGDGWLEARMSLLEVLETLGVRYSHEGGGRHLIDVPQKVRDCLERVQPQLRWLRLFAMTTAHRERLERDKSPPPHETNGSAGLGPSQAEAARMLGVSRQRVGRLLDKGELDRVGTKVDPMSLVMYIERNEMIYRPEE